MAGFCDSYRAFMYFVMQNKILELRWIIPFITQYTPGLEQFMIGVDDLTAEPMYDWSYIKYGKKDAAVISKL